MKIHLNWIIPTLLLKKKFIWHQRTTLPDSRVVRRLIKLASKIISISNFVKNSIPMSLENKIKVIYNPIENSNKSKIKKVKFINKNKQILIGSFSNLQSIKQPEILIQIAEILKKKNTQYKICSFGDDKEKLFNNFKKIIIKKDLRKFIEFYGFQYPIEPWILKIDMIIATSLNDGFGRTILEGMFLRKPVIASNAGGHREIIEQNINGVLVEKSLPYEYFKAIEKIAKNSRFRKKIIKNGFEKSQDFSIQKIISDVVKIYE
jgi:glycosyltransferase involved in cell wall biosynthesis